ncbi:hypothetical protein H5410_032319 [Solanum commersonii]|uniref:Uncharacterized protein n=1 Tax=Solanum commersonii TaxID=4109 RepID=A0A9J5YLV1_SOLCO|nr:hypothetical protein H5410_032319 [Solanum commersonii]
MYDAWGTCLDNSINDDIEDVGLMAMEDSESDIDKREINSDLKKENQFLKEQEVLEDVPCEGEYFGDPIVEQSSVVRLNLGASSEGESMGDPFVEPSSSIGIYIN